MPGFPPCPCNADGQEEDRSRLATRMRRIRVDFFIDSGFAREQKPVSILLQEQLEVWSPLQVPASQIRRRVPQLKLEPLSRTSQCIFWHAHGVQEWFGLDNDYR